MLLCIVITYASCKKEIQLGPSGTALLHLPDQDRGFIVIAKEGANINAISAAITKLGDKKLKLKGAIEELGLIQVQTPDPRFAERARQISGVEAVAVDVVTNWRLPEKVEKVSKKEMAALKAKGTKGKKPIVNDNPYSFLQWGIQSIHADKAWSKGYGGKLARDRLMQAKRYRFK